MSADDYRTESQGGEMPDEPVDLALRNSIAEKVIALLFSLRPGQGDDGNPPSEMAAHAWSLDAACLAVSRAILAANGHLENDPKDLIQNVVENITTRVEARRSQYFAQKLSKKQEKVGLM